MLKKKKKKLWTISKISKRATSWKEKWK